MTISEFLQLMDNTLVVNEKLTLNTKRTDIEEWDSVGQISILSMLKNFFGVTLEMEELVTLETIQDIVNILRSRNINLD
ncbi:MAG: phosphopantetheine-binding protein [Candidatus Brocadiaceae bacterium]|nr:phosphopantetheine-binding protein [Candidatus Brocadiaceae bacterium]